MEKSIELIARYHYEHGYFVEVTQENSVIAGRDYWLCQKNNSRKMFMFTSKFKNEDLEKNQILEHIIEDIKKFEQVSPAAKVVSA